MKIEKRVTDLEYKGATLIRSVFCKKNIKKIDEKKNEMNLFEILHQIPRPVYAEA